MVPPVESAASLVLLEFQKAYGLGFVGPSGRIVTSFHVVADEPEILAHLADGRKLPVRSVSALDLQRDLAVLDVGLLDARPLTSREARLDDGGRAWVFGMVPGEGRARFVEVQVGERQALGSDFSAYRLSGDVPQDASGGPVLALDGSVLGVVTIADSEDGLVVLAIPFNYVEPLLLRNAESPLSVLAQPNPERAPGRDVPRHPLSLLEGASITGLEATTEALATAIEHGAPAYNAGEVGRCYSLYRAAALALVKERGDCPGVQRALLDGLRNGEALDDVGQQAWALRDAFDGLLSVIERYLKAHLSVAATTGKKATYLN